jgi:CheY-like chemotaxis protein
MPHVLVVHESQSVRSDLGRALEGEGMTVVEADSSGAAIRELWGGTFDAALVSPQMARVGNMTLEEHLKSLAPEVITMPIDRDPATKQARKLAELLDGSLAA